MIKELRALFSSPLNLSKVWLAYYSVKPISTILLIFSFQSPLGLAYFKTHSLAVWLNLLISVLYISATTLSYGESFKLTWFSTTHKSLNWQKWGSNRQSWWPFILKNIQTNHSSLRGNVWMPNLCGKLHLGRFVRIFRRNGYVNFKDPIFITRVVRSFDVGFPSSVVLVDQADFNIIIIFLCGQIMILLLDSFVSHKL